MVLCGCAAIGAMGRPSGSPAAARLCNKTLRPSAALVLLVRRDKERIVSDRTATLPSPLAATKSPPPAAVARTKRILEGPIFTTLMKLSAPNVLNLLAFAGMVTFDGFFLGRLGSDTLAGASLVFPWVMLVLQSTNNGMGTGVSSAVARAIGAGNSARANALVFHAFLLALALGAIFSAVMLLGGPTLFRLMGGQDDMLDAALAYAYVALGGAAGICLLNFMGNAVRGTGNMALPAGVLVACVLAHIAISPILIFGFGPLPALGAAGAAWGLVLPFAVGAMWFVWYLHAGRALVRLTFRGMVPRWELFADILKVGVPGLVDIAITNLSVVVLTGIAARMGRDIAIGYAMGARLEYIMQPIAFGFGTAIVAMVGTNWGARQYARARGIALTGVTTIAAVCGTIGITVAIFPALWLGLFSDDPDVFHVGGLYLHIVAPLYLCFGLGRGLFFVSLGLGRAAVAAGANAVRLAVNVVCGLVAVYWLGLGAAGFFAAIAVGFALYAALLLYAVLRASEPAAEPDDK
jgi:putative MATE family efflux protein